MARIEKKGIPTFSITRKGFKSAVSFGFQAMGLGLDVPQHEYPLEMFLPGSDLTPLEQSIDDIINGLTKWKPGTEGRIRCVPTKVAIEGNDYLETITRLNNTFLKNKWGDGLPILPATEGQVRWILTGTDSPKDIVLGKIPPAGRVATIESLAVSLAMTGGRPEYLPILVATVKAFLSPLFGAVTLQTTTSSVYPVVIVNGPIGRQIRLNSGYGCLGPDPAHPAGAIIGRALRLIQQNIGGAIPRSGTMAIYGGPARFTNIVFAEDESGLPAGWEILSVERGFSSVDNIVTLYSAATTSNVNAARSSTEKVLLETLNRFARIMAGNYGNIFGDFNDKSAPGIVLMPRGIVQGLASLGWSKERVKAYLWENSKVPYEVIKSDSVVFATGQEILKSYVKEGEAWPLASEPKNIMIVVAGGEQSGHGYWLRYGPGPKTPISAEIQLPKNWATLLKEAEEDLDTAQINRKEP
jgi:hypothetical protein